jgi:diguanylate cyclase (GGDEF)-like protein
VIPGDARGRRRQAAVLLFSLALLGVAWLIEPLGPVVVPSLVAGAVALAAAGGGIAGLPVAVFEAGLAPLPTPLRVAFGVAGLVVFERTARVRETADEMREHAFVDRLTGLCTYSYFVEHLAHELQRVRRYGGRCSLVVFDLDRFKDFNDRYGHGAGNEFLGRVGEAILQLKRDSDVGARFGGEELVVVVPGSASQAERLAERVRLRVSEIHLIHRGQPVGTTVSAGVAEFPRDGDDEDALFRAADRALYQAKHLGRDRVVGAVPDRAPAASRLQSTAAG